MVTTTRRAFLAAAGLAAGGLAAEALNPPKAFANPGPSVAAPIDALLNSYVAYRASAALGSPNKNDLDACHPGAELRTHLQYATPLLVAGEKHIRTLHPGYAAASPAVTYRVLEQSTTRLTLDVREVTTLRFADGFPEGSPASSMYAANHTAVIDRTSTGWSLRSAEFQPRNLHTGIPITQSLDELTENQVATANAAAAASAVPLDLPPEAALGNPLFSAQPRLGPSGPNPPQSNQYDYANMVAYARRFAINHNPAYKSYTEDCTNFISQCMVAGGWKQSGPPLPIFIQNPAFWFYGPRGVIASHAWTLAEGFVHWAYFTGPAYWVTSWNLNHGDVIGYKYDKVNVGHVQIVTAVVDPGDGRPQMQWVTQHDADYVDKPLSEVLAQPNNKDAMFYIVRS